jgi:hypothetical protein
LDQPFAEKECSRLALECDLASEQDRRGFGILQNKPHVVSDDNDGDTATVESG